MMHLVFPSKLGTFEFFHLLYFRKRQFPHKTGRFQLPLPWEALDFEDPVKEWRPDFSIRWSHSIYTTGHSIRTESRESRVETDFVCKQPNFVVCKRNLSLFSTLASLFFKMSSSVHSIKKIDIGLSHFYGNGREPFILLTEDFQLRNVYEITS